MFYAQNCLLGYLKYVGSEFCFKVTAYLWLHKKYFCTLLDISWDWLVNTMLKASPEMITL